MKSLALIISIMLFTTNVQAAPPVPFEGAPPPNPGQTIAGKSQSPPATSNFSPFMGEISGYIIDYSSKPIPGANISIGNFLTKSDSNGLYKIEIDGGEYVLKINASGYLSNESQIKIKSGEQMLINFTLILSKENVSNNQSNQTIKSKPIELNDTSRLENRTETKGEVNKILGFSIFPALLLIILIYLRKKN